MRTPAARGAALCQWAVLGTLAPAILLALLPGYAMDLPFRLLCAGVETLLALCMGVCLAWGGSQLQKAEAIRRTARLLLVVYLVHLASLLFFDGSFGRQATFSWHRLDQPGGQPVGPGAFGDAAALCQPPLGAAGAFAVAGGRPHCRGGGAAAGHRHRQLRHR